MKNDKDYTLFEPGEINHIGTVRGATMQILRDFIIVACENHFDETIEVEDLAILKAIEDLNKHNYGTFEITMSYEEERWDKEVAIAQTWIYG